MTKQSSPLPYKRASVVLGLALLAASVLLLALRGAILPGAALAVAGLLAAYLASRASTRTRHHINYKNFGKGPPGTLKQLTTQYLDGQVDTTTGILRATITKGMFEGQDVGTLHPAELALLWQDSRTIDPSSAQSIETHLDATCPKWRDNVRRGEEQLATGPDGRMSIIEAYKILGLSKGATGEQIRHTHRDLMLKLHPDKGGSTYLASKINEAKDVLLSDFQQ